MNANNDIRRIVLRYACELRAEGFQCVRISRQNGRPSGGLRRIYMLRGAEAFRVDAYGIHQITVSQAVHEEGY